MELLCPEIKFKYFKKNHLLHLVLHIEGGCKPEWGLSNS